MTECLPNLKKFEIHAFKTTLFLFGIIKLFMNF